MVLTLRQLMTSKNPLKLIRDGINNAAAGVLAAGSVSTDELANGAVTESKLGTGAVTSGKISDGAIGYAKTKSEQKPGLGDGAPDLAKLTAAFGDPATLTDGFVATYKDTSDSNAQYIITVSNGVFQKSVKLTPVSA